MTSPKRTNWRAIELMLTVGIFGALHIDKLPPALVIIRADLGFSLIEAGYVLSMFSLLGMSLSVFMGGLAEWLGRRRLLIGGFTALAHGGAIAALSEGEMIPIWTPFFELAHFFPSPADLSMSPRTTRQISRVSWGGRSSAQRLTVA